MSEGSAQGSLVGARLGKYEVLALLAVGGTAEIYLARIGGEAGFEKYVVVKVLLDHLTDQDEYVRMFLDEARLGAQLDHSNIVQTLELGRHDDRYYMVMEYLAGMSLSTIARRAAERIPGGIGVDLSLNVTAQTCAGLHYAHERSTPDGRALNMIHRDISPQNLVVSFEGVVKIVDFGIAKAAMRETHTKSGTIKGKFAYMSPEQCLGHDIDRRSDIFSLGTILHELLTGQRLFKRDSTYATYQAIVNGQVKPPSAYNPAIDPALDAVVLRALAYDREQRYPSAEAFGEALLTLLHRRGRSVGPGDLGRFFDTHFQHELSIHSQRMRELMTGSRPTVEDVTWHSEEELVSDSAGAMPDDQPEVLESADVGMETIDQRARPARSTTDDGWDDDGDAPTRVQDPGGSAGDDDLDDEERESTRIEPNPLLRVQTMHARISRTGGPGGEARRTIAPGGATPTPAPAPAPVGKGRQRTSRPTQPGVAQRAQTDTDAETVAGRRQGKPYDTPSRQSERTAAVSPQSRNPKRTMMAPAVPIPVQTPPPQRIAAPAPRANVPLPLQAQQSSRMEAAPAAPMAQPPAPQPAIAAPSAGSGQASQQQPPQPQQPYDAYPGYAPTQPQQPVVQPPPAAAGPAYPVAPQPPSGQFPPVNTPTAFRARGDLLNELPAGYADPSSDLAALRAQATTSPPPWMLAAAFAAAAAVACGMTVALLRLL